MSKRKPAHMTHKAKDGVNKKALIWTGSVMLGIIILMAVLLILNK